MLKINTVTPNLEDRFLPPDNWREGSFENKDRHLVFGYVLPEGQARAAVVICAGRSEFREKYFETMRDLLGRGLAVFIMDWYGQGRSDRCSGNAQMDWDTPYGDRVADLHRFIEDHVRPTLPAGTPLVMLSHSMGGNIGMRYLQSHPGIFNAAAFSAPMLGVRALGFLSPAISTSFFSHLSFFHDHYLPHTHGNWHEKVRKPPGTDIFSSDPVRDGVHNAWCKANPELRLGDVSCGFLHNALESCNSLFESAVTVDIPVYVATAGHEKLVDNYAAENFVRERLPDAVLERIDGAWHEILMEKDEHRNRFMAGFDNLLLRANIPA